MCCVLCAVCCALCGVCVCFVVVCFVVSSFRSLSLPFAVLHIFLPGHEMGALPRVSPCVSPRATDGPYSLEAPPYAR